MFKVKEENIITDLRRTAQTMRELGDLVKADLLTYVADYIEEKRTQNASVQQSTETIARPSATPLGVIPWRAFYESRRDDLRCAICEYACEGLQVNPEWVEEYNELVERLQNVR